MTILILHMIKNTQQVRNWSNLHLSDFPGDSVVKNPPPNAGDMGLIIQSGRSPGGGNGNPLRYSCLQNPTDRGAWRATVHGFAKSQTLLIIARHGILHMIEIIYRKTTAHNISSDKKKNSYSLLPKFRNKIRIFVTTPMHHTEFPSQYNKSRKINLWEKQFAKEK